MMTDPKCPLSETIISDGLGFWPMVSRMRKELICALPIVAFDSSGHFERGTLIPNIIAMTALRAATLEFAGRAIAQAL
jgi:hypothetical protein